MEKHPGKRTISSSHPMARDNGKRYEQFDGNDKIPCYDCVFRGKDHCQHPHYYDGYKGYCGKPYREVKE